MPTPDHAGVLKAAADVDAGLEHAIRHGIDRYWAQLVVVEPKSQLMQHELLIYALGTPGLENLGRWQMERYSRVVANVTGVVLQYIADPDQGRAESDLQAIAEMLVRLAGARPATRD